MSNKANYIKQRLSLREPLKESLDVVVQLANVLELKKDIDLKEELEKVKAQFPTCQDFEREFPSICFSSMNRTLGEESKVNFPSSLRCGVVRYGKFFVRPK